MYIALRLDFTVCRGLFAEGAVAPQTMRDNGGKRITNAFSVVRDPEYPQGRS